jgi:hypothetical protein
MNLDLDALPDDLSGRTWAEIVGRVGSPSYARWAEQAARCGYCARPIRLTGRKLVGGVEVYNTDSEPDRVLLKRCRNRRAVVCPSCSFEYAGDMWQLLCAGLAGGRKGLPESIADHPMVFATLTAPSFGLVHSLRERKGQAQRCRPRRDHPLCPHGRPLWCMTTHREGDEKVGQPLCPDCYDYTAAVLFNWSAPELWRRFTINLRRCLALELGIRDRKLGQTVRVSFAKVAEFHRRGVVHFHAIIRLDAPGDGWQPPNTDLPAETLQATIATAIGRTRLVSNSGHGQAVALHWGRESDLQPILNRPDLAEGELTPRKVAAYIAKYAVKGAEDFGISGRRLDGDQARRQGATDHVVRMIDTAIRLSGEVDTLASLTRWTHMLGFRGHFASKSRRFSVTLGCLRRARADYRRRQDVDQRRQVRELDHDQTEEDDTTLLVGEWRFVGVGYTTSGDAALAAASAAYAREWREAMGCKRTATDKEVKP